MTEPNEHAEAISADEIRTLAALAKLSIDDSAAERLRAELGAVLVRARCLLEADLEGVGPMSTACEEVNRLSDDEPGGTLPPPSLERLAPWMSGGLFPVPNVLPGSGS